MYYINRDDFPTYYQYRKAVSAARQVSCAVRNVSGGVVVFETYTELSLWQSQK